MPPPPPWHIPPFPAEPPFPPVPAEPAWPAEPAVPPGVWHLMPATGEAVPPAAALVAADAAVPHADAAAVPETTERPRRLRLRVKQPATAAYKDHDAA